MLTSDLSDAIAWQRGAYIERDPSIWIILYEIENSIQNNVDDIFCR